MNWNLVFSVLWTGLRNSQTVARKFPELREDGTEILKTQGDMILDKSLMELCRAFTKELDVALFADSSTFAFTHEGCSTWIPAPFCRARFFEQTNDAFIYKDGSVTRIEDFCSITQYGTASSAVNPSSAAKNPTFVRQLSRW
jgi:porphobilinogen deaminase